MKGESRCFFMGHRDTPDSVYPSLVRAVENHIMQYGVMEFIVGRYGRFDYMAAVAVMEAKRQHPEIQLTLLLPYHPSEKKIDLPKGFDGNWYPSEMEAVPKRVAIVRANQCAVDQVGYLISYVRHSASNTWKLVEYARKKIMVTEL